MKLEQEVRLRELELQAQREGNRPRSPTPDIDGASTHSSSAQAMNFPMPVFDPKAENIEQYLDRFGKLASLYNLERNMYTLKLAQGLRGEAYEIYQRMPTGTETDYDALCQALLKRFELNAATYRQKFRNERKMTGENYPQFASRLQGYLTRWREMSGYSSSFEDLQEMILTEQLRETLPRPMQTFLTENGADRLSEMLMYAERYEMAHKEVGIGGKPKAQGQGKNNGNGHKTHPNESPKKNSSQAQPQNPSKVQGTQHRQPFNGPKKPYCHICKNNNHWTKECKSKQSGNLQVSALLSTVVPSTQEQLYNGSNRPPVVERVWANGYSLNCLYDSGLSYGCVVRPEFVKPDQYTGRFIELQCATLDAKPLNLPIAKIKVRSKYVSGVIEAAVLEHCTFDLILGATYVFLAEPKKPSEHLAAVTTRAQHKSALEDSPHVNPLPEEIKVAQSSDPTLKACFKKLTASHNPPLKKEFFMKGKLLYRWASDKYTEHSQLVVPKTYRQQILQMGHTIAYSAHMGIHATTQRIACHYFWPGMSADIMRYVKSCPECQKVAPKGRNAPVGLGETPVTSTPFERVAVDLVGPLPLTKKKNAYILTLVDCCSGYPEAVALRRIDSKTVAEALMSIFTRVGFPSQILTDNGSQFKGKLMEEVFQIIKSQHICTSPYRPQANGQNERFNGTLVSLLRRLTQEKPERWDEYLSAALFAYREVPNASTGFPPATLVFGRPISGPLAILRKTWTDEGADDSLKKPYHSMCRNSRNG
ncbi:unnamed protein product [Candidula unifasciata]|uniref:Integrase catalytic domain-containing protein n=1 Tax=Candidula unifasciata TaxID=100452 RepID=A0A8S3ZAH9_9EUPU|nr:unnamed protein product [Candidula unifasciata]